MQRELFLVLEAIRGLAAILVALRHFLPSLFPIRFPMSYLAVDVFFMLSGVVIAHAYETALKTGGMSLGRFMMLRILRIYPLYLLGLLIGFLAVTQIADPHQQYNPAAAAWSLLLLPSFASHDLFPFNEPGWSLLFELVISLVYGAILVRLPTSATWLMTSLGGLLLIYGSLQSGYGVDLGYRRVDFIFGFGRVAFSFGVGVLLYRQFLERGRPVLYGNRAAVLTVLATMIVLMMPLTTGVWRTYFGLFAVFLCFPVIVFLAIRTRISDQLARIAMVSGAISFPLYAVHAPLYVLIAALFEKAMGFPLRDFAPLAGLMIIVLFCMLAYWLHHHVDVPFRSWARRRFG